MDSPQYHQGFDNDTYMYDGSSIDVKPDYADSEYSNQSYSGSSSPRYTELGNAESDNMLGQSPITGHDILFNNQVDVNAWRSKPVEYWDNMDVIMWIQDYGSRNGYTRVSPEQFSDLNGMDLQRMGLEEFQQRDPEHGTDYFCGILNLRNTTDQYYRTCYAPSQQSVPLNNNNDHGMGVEKLTSIENYIHNYNISFNPDEKFNSLILPPMDSFRQSAERPPQSTVKTDQVVPKLEELTPPGSPASSEASSVVTTRATNGRRGRSKGKLWEFVLNLLKDSKYNPTIIKWEDRDNGVFRIVRSDQVAKLWGTRKQNPSMTYEKMSRAMRYYYKKNILERIDGRRLVYKFGDNSKGWQQ